MTIQEIASRLAGHCIKQDFEAAQKELYAENAVSIEPRVTPPFTKETKGLDAIIQKGRLWMSMLEKFHDCKVSEPMIAGNCFALKMTLDVTMKGMGHKLFEEISTYTVADGKIVSEQFFN